MTALAALPVAVPLAAAAVLLAVGHKLPWRIPDVVAIAVALFCMVATGLLAEAARHGPIVYWFGGWQPRDGVAIGIGFVVDAAGAMIAALVCALFAGSFIFAWGYFDEVGARFHVLMLLFMAAMIGFCLTGDLFNLFVFFELMSVAAFALTAYQLEASALEGAMNFTVTNTLGSFLILGGIALIYGRTGALNFAQLGRAVAALGNDPVVIGSFVLLTTGFLVKAAMVPFHFWLADAHAVAPSPVSVIFSGAMVGLGAFGVVRVYWAVFASAPAVAAMTSNLIVDLGAASALVGGIACLAQRHLKRLLAFSTIAHIGILLIGLALADRGALAGALLYFAGHGLIKGALFMLAGILLALCLGIDEIELRGAGRRLPLTGLVFLVAGLLLAGAPIGIADEGLTLIDAAAAASGRSWLRIAVLAGTALSGAAVLRAGGRIFLGLGQMAGEERDSPSDEEHEKPDRPLWLMLLPIVLFLALVFAAAPLLDGWAENGAAQLVTARTDAAAVLDGAAPAALPPMPKIESGAGHWLPWVSLGLAIAIAAFQLGRGKLPKWLTRLADLVTAAPFAFVRATHNGVVGDYVVWLVAGLAAYAISAIIAGS